METSRSDGELAGKTAIVTGASRGIGAAIAKSFLRAGAGVVITGRNAKAGEDAASELSRFGDVIFVKADHGSDADWAGTVAAALSRFGRLDILVANAGESRASPIAEMTLDDFREMNRTHLKGSFLGIKHAAEALRRHGEGGAIILMSSIVGLVGVPGLVHYSAAKGGIRLMAKAAALELGPEKIRVNSIHPGMIHTDMTARFSEAQFAENIPLGKFGEPADIANAAVFLAGPRGVFVTGTELVVDGGWIAR